MGLVMIKIAMQLKLKKKPSDNSTLQIFPLLTTFAKPILLRSEY